MLISASIAFIVPATLCQAQQKSLPHNFAMQPKHSLRSTMPFQSWTSFLMKSSVWTSKLCRNVEKVHGSHHQEPKHLLLCSFYTTLCSWVHFFSASLSQSPNCANWESKTSVQQMNLRTLPRSSKVFLKTTQKTCNANPCFPLSDCILLRNSSMASLSKNFPPGICCRLEYSALESKSACLLRTVNHSNTVLRKWRPRQ